MKTVNKALKFLFFFSLATVLFVAPLFAQTVDSTATGPSSVTTIFGIPIPAIVQTAIVALLIMLPAVQLVLKRIPTDGSVKIQGFLGKILDVLTFFQKDKVR